MGAQVIVGDAGVGVDHPGGALRVLGVDLGGDQHGVVAQRPGVEDRRDLSDDPLVEQPAGAGEDIVEIELGLGGDQGEGLGVEREARLQQVHQPLVVLVERNRGAIHARARLRVRDLQHNTLPLTRSQRTGDGCSLVRVARAKPPPPSRNR